MQDKLKISPTTKHNISQIDILLLLVMLMVNIKYILVYIETTLKCVYAHVIHLVRNRHRSCVQESRAIPKSARKEWKREREKVALFSTNSLLPSFPSVVQSSSLGEQSVFRFRWYFERSSLALEVYQLNVFSWSKCKVDNSVTYDEGENYRTTNGRLDFYIMCIVRLCICRTVE